MYSRRQSSEARVGGIGIGGQNPIRIQSMGTVDTNNTLGLGHTALGIIGIYRSHRLNADGVLTANADTADTGFGRLSSAIH